MSQNEVFRCRCGQWVTEDDTCECEIGNPWQQGQPVVENSTLCACGDGCEPDIDGLPLCTKQELGEMGYGEEVAA